MEIIQIKNDIELSLREKEVYRALRTNLEFTGVENKVIAVTSCTPDDGKTVVSYNLSVALAESEKTTLLVDADLRRSVLMQRLNVNRLSKGLSHFLAGHATGEDVIYCSSQKNLYLIPPGIFPSNPTELLGNHRFVKLMDYVRKSFDYVIVDTPPLGNVIDAAVIAKQCDGSILVVSSNKSSRKEVQQVANQLKSANSNLLGVVLNKVNYKEKGYYSKKYGYHSYYGGYGKTY